MRHLFKSLTLISILSVLVLTNFSSATLAEKPGMNSDYIGISAGDGTLENSGHITINGRVQLGEELPLSVRSSLQYATEGNDEAWFGTVTYDVPVFNQTNAYLGTGIGLMRRDINFSLIFQAGLERAITQKLVVFSDITYLPTRGEFPWKLGVGYRF